MFEYGYDDPDKIEEYLKGNKKVEINILKKNYSLEFCYKFNTNRILDNEDGYYVVQTAEKSTKSPEKVIF